MIIKPPSFVVVPSSAAVPEGPFPAVSHSVQGIADKHNKAESEIELEVARVVDPARPWVAAAGVAAPLLLLDIAAAAAPVLTTTPFAFEYR